MRKAGIAMLSVACVFMLYACGKSADMPAAVQENVTGVSVLSYEEREAGTDIYPVRVLVSAGYLRLDDGYADSDYVLLDRESKTIFSISHEERSILVIENRPASLVPPADLQLTETRTPASGAPVVAGKQPVHTNYLANGKLCYQSINVPDVMGEAVAGMTEYAELLARRQLNNMDSVPGSMQTPCFLSRYVYAPGRHYQQGLPIQEWDDSGYFRTLSDFSANETLPATLFALPEEYERFSPGF